MPTPTQNLDTTGIDISQGAAARTAPLTVRRTSGWACMECGHKFRTVAGAERAAFGDKGCPKCGGSDIDLTGAG